MNRMPRVYTGRDGLKGISRIGTASCLDEVLKLKKRPSVYVGGGGVRMRTVLADGGIVSGGMKAVSGGVPSPSIVTKPKPEKRLEEFSKAKVEMGKKIIEAEAKAEKLGETEVCRSKMEMAREPNLAVAAAKAEEAAIEPQMKPPTMEVQSEEPMGGRGEGTRSEVGITETEERPADFLGAAQGLPEAGAGEMAEETREVLPELPLGETKAGGGKKRRRRRVAESTEVSEAERAAIQTDLEAASDAAANEG